MVVFRATTTFFIFFLDAQCFGKELIRQKKALSDCEILVNKKEVLLCAVCSLIKEESTYYTDLPEEYEEHADRFQNFCERPRYPVLYTVQLFPFDTCPELSAILYSGFMDAISRLPPPGGTTALDIFRTVIIASYHLSLRFMKEFHNFSSPSLRVDIVFDADYESVLGEKVVEFRDYLLHHLKIVFRRSQSDIHTLTIKKGSIGITFFINLMNCAHSNKLDDGYSLSSKNHFHKQQRKLHHHTSESAEVNLDETDFVSFLRHLKYDLSFKHYHLLRRIPYSVRTSIFDNSEQWTKKLHSLGFDINRRNIQRNEHYQLYSIYTSEYGKKQKQESPSNVIRSSDEGIVNEKLSHHYFRRKPYENVPLNRIRRYVAREEESTMKLKVEFKLLKPAKKGNQDELHKHLVSQLAREMRVPIPSIKDMKITSETDVSFTLSAFNDENNVMNDLSVIEAADSLKAKIKSQKLRLKDLNGQFLMTAGSAYASVEDSANYSLVILVILCVTLLILTIIIIAIIYVARRTSRVPRSSSKSRHEPYKDFTFGRDSSQSVGKYSYDSGLWLGPGPEPNFTVPEAPLYRPPTVEQIASTPRPVTAVRTRLKKNWNVDERALSTIPDDFGRTYVEHEHPPR